MALSRSISDYHWTSSYGDEFQNQRMHSLHNPDLPPLLNVQEAYAAPSVSGPRFFVTDNVPPPPPRISPYHPLDPTPQQTVVAFSNAPIDPVQLQQHLSRYGSNQCTLVTTNTAHVHFQSQASANQALTSPNFYLLQQPIGLIRKQTNPPPTVLLERGSPQQILKPQPPPLHIPVSPAYHPTEPAQPQGLAAQVWEFLTGW